MKTTITLISLSAILACLVLSAQETPPKSNDVSADPRLKRFDKNGDGKIDDSERAAIREFMRQRGQKTGAMTPSGKVETVGNREITEMDYASSDGRKIPCVLSMPKGGGPFPCIVTIHGGQGNRDLGYIRTLAAPNPISPTVNTLNEQAWAILAISYRSGEGVMSDGEQSDVVAGIRFAKTLPKIDAARVGVLGGSHGGHLALRAAELMGNEFLCVAVGSPWMTDPFVYMMGKADQPPLSQLSAAARKQITSNGKQLLKGMKTRGLSDAEVKAHLSKNSIEANAEKIVIPSLFMTSLSDEQAPHLLVKPTFDKLKAAGRDVTVFTVEKNPHGFYWGRSVGGARNGKGEKSETELAEENATREQIVAFFTKQFARKDPPVAASPKTTTPDIAGSYADIKGDEIFAFVDAVAGVSRKAREDGMLDYGRICGTKYDKMTADYVKQQFTEFGVDQVWQETFPNGGPQWIPSEVKLTLIGGSSPAAPREDHEFKTAMVAYSVRYTPAGGIEAPIVDVGKGEAADLEGLDLTGKIALVHAYVQGQIYRHSAQQVVPKLAREGKALGVVIAIHQPGDPDVRYAITGGRGASEISYVNIAGGDGAFLAKVIKDSGATAPRVRLTVRGEILSNVTTQNTFGLIRGTGEEYILFTAHTDCHFQGATDNASGVAVLLALAEHFARQPRAARRRTLVFVADGGHHSGPGIGIRNLVATKGDWLKKTALVVNLEHVASLHPAKPGGLQAGSEVTSHLLYLPNRNALLQQLFEEAMRRYRVPYFPGVQAEYQADLFPFAPTKLPAVMLLQPMIWYHTESDTPDKISPQGLEGVAKVYATVIDQLNDVPRERLQAGEQFSEQAGTSDSQPSRPASPTTTSGDAPLTREQFKARLTKSGGPLADRAEVVDRLFDRLDENKDGVLSTEESAKLKTLRGSGVGTRPPANPDNQVKPTVTSFASETKTDSRITPTSSQSAAIRKLREKMANMPVPENLQRRNLKIGDKEREFFINIPASVKGKIAPVVFALHGGASSSGLAQHSKVDYTKLGEQEGYVTVYPSGVNGWNIGSHDAYSVKRRTSDADDLGFFRAMFDTLIKEGIADPQRIYITGGSNGGVMTQFLVCHLADRIAGAGVMVATLPAAVKDWPKPARPIPVIIMLGTVDPMKPWNGNADQLSADATVEYWRKQNGCTGDAKKWDLADRDPNDGTRIRAQRWEGKAPVVFYTMEGHGHGWPMQKGRDETGTGPKTRDISAAEEFWKFFQSAAQSASAQPTAKP